MRRRGCEIKGKSAENAAKMARSAKCGAGLRVETESLKDADVRETLRTCRIAPQQRLRCVEELVRVPGLNESTQWRPAQSHES